MAALRAANNAVSSQPLGFGQSASMGRRDCEPAVEVGRPRSEIVSSRTHTVPFHRASLAVGGWVGRTGVWGNVVGTRASGASRSILRRGGVVYRCGPIQRLEEAHGTKVHSKGDSHTAEADGARNTSNAIRASDKNWSIDTGCSPIQWPKLTKLLPDQAEIDKRRSN